MSDLSLDQQFLDAARQGRTALFSGLLECGSNINARYRNGWAALHIAALEGKVNVCLALIGLGAEPDILGPDDRTPLHLAAWREHTAVCQALLDQGAQIQAQKVDGKTALHLAALKGNPETCVALIDRGAQLEAKDCDGWTALLFAASAGNIDASLALIAHGADPSNGPEDMRSLTPIEAAARGGFIPRLMTLLETEETDHQALSSLALDHGQEEAAAAICSHAARAQIHGILNAAVSSERLDFASG